MNKITKVILNNKLILITLWILFYGLILRIYLPYHMPIHENNHWIFFINELYNINYNLRWILDSSIFINNSFIEQMNYWLVPKYFYSYLVNILWLSYWIIFVFQIIFNLLTILFLWLSIYKITWKKLLYYIILLLWTILPYNIYFSSTDEFLVMWNFFISLSFYLYILFFKKEKYSYFYLSILFYILALYTRNLYLIFSVFYIVWLLFFLFEWKYKNKKLIINFLFWIIIFFIFIFSRIKVFLFSKDKNFNSFNSSIDLSWIFTSWLIPDLYIIFILLSIILPVYYFIKKGIKKLNILLYYFLIILLYYYILLLINLWNIFLLQERLQNIFIPYFIIFSSIWLYYILFKFKYNYIILFTLLLLPFFYINNIRNIYSPQMDYLFIENNFNKLWDNFNLVILWLSDKSVFNNFPEFLIKNKNYNIYWINWKDYRYKSFITNYDKIINNNYFILSYDCYRGNNIWKYMRKECEYIENNYYLEVISEKFILNKSYIFNNSSLEKVLKIWIYKIIWKKW